MKLPRDLGGEELAARLRRHGYETTRQAGSHIRLTTFKQGEHHVTIPRHNPLRVGTLNAVLRDVADHLGVTRDELIRSLME
ncbi:MAG: type II toxin-antitoxin system HicA family toxin [Anaerolineae bacterium]